MSVPLVSIITSNYNCAHYLPDCVHSVLQQSFDSWEHIIIDCGSTDTSLQVLESLKHPRMRIVQEGFCGVARARNLAVGHSRGAFCAVLDADDMAFPNRLSQQMEVLQRNPGILAAGGGFQVRYLHHQRWQQLFLPATRDYRFPGNHEEIMLFLQLVITPIAHSTLTYSKSAFQKVGGYRETMEKSEDFDLLVRLGSIGSLANVPELVGILRLGGSTSHTHRHRPRGRDVMYYAVLSLLEKAAAAGHAVCSKQEIEAWLDTLGKRGILAMQGRWIWSGMMKRQWRVSEAGSIIFRSFVRCLPAILSCRGKPWWGAIQSPETAIKAITQANRRTSANSLNELRLP